MIYTTALILAITLIFLIKGFREPKKVKVRTESHIEHMRRINGRNK